MYTHVYIYTCIHIYMNTYIYIQRYSSYTYIYIKFTHAYETSAPRSGFGRADIWREMDGNEEKWREIIWQNF